MTHQFTYYILVAGLFICLAILATAEIKKRLAASRRSFSMIGKNGAKITFVLGPDDDFGEVVARKLREFDSKSAAKSGVSARTAGKR